MIEPMCQFVADANDPTIKRCVRPNCGIVVRGPYPPEQTHSNCKAGRTTTFAIEFTADNSPPSFVPRCEGVGTLCSRIIQKRFGEMPCRLCMATIVEMNTNGPDWCEQNIDHIAEKISLSLMVTLRGLFAATRDEPGKATLVSPVSDVDARVFCRESEGRDSRGNRKIQRGRSVDCERTTVDSNRRTLLT